MIPVEPILAAPLLPKLEAKLLDLLRSLLPEDWDKATIAPGWTVRNVTAHLLDTSLRKLSIVRDGFCPQPFDLHRLNREGVEMYSHLSPQVLMALIEVSSRESCEFHLALDPFAPAAFGVSWAGESESPNWFDTARELTERWHHQQQIRLATNRPGIMTRELYHPVLDCFLRALPYAYRDAGASVGSTLQVSVTGDCGDDWFLHRHEEDEWLLLSEPAGDLVAAIHIPEEIAWRIFTRGISHADAEAQIEVEGDARLALHVLNVTAIVT